MNLFQPYPDKIYVGITDRCNANCIMCWRVGESGFSDMADSIIDPIIQMLPYIKEVGWWSAGEFFSYNRIEWLLDELKKYQNVKHSFSTNAIKLADYAEKLSSINVGEIIVSIDGATEDTLSRIRVGVHLSDIIDGIEAIKKWFTRSNRALPVIKFIFVGMKDNIAEFPELVELASKLGVNEVVLETLVVHPKCNLDDQMLKKYPNLETKMYRLAESKAKELGVKIEHTRELS